MSTTTTTRTKKQLSPVHGSVKVLRPFGEVNDTTAEIAINSKPYYLSRLELGFRLTGYDTCHQEVTVYDLPLDLSSCDCPDATYRGERPGGCKHQKAIRALLSSGNL